MHLVDNLGLPAQGFLGGLAAGLLVHFLEGERQVGADFLQQGYDTAVENADSSAYKPKAPAVSPPIRIGNTPALR